jgi:ATP-dependent RNA helicase RhlE
MSFDALALHPVLRRGVAALGIREPTPIQAALVPPALEGRDVIGLAPTGTGKTLGYLLPVAHRLLADPPTLERRPRRSSKRSAARVVPETRLRALVLCPTRELVQQAVKDARALFRGSLLKVAGIWGKVPLAPQREAIKGGVDLLVGTPGRVRECLDLDALSLVHIRHVVIDEADRMLDLGFLPQVTGILERMPPQRQMLLLTATYPPQIEGLVARFLCDPVRVDAPGHTRPAAHVAQTLYAVDDAAKTAVLLALLAQGPRRGVLVFVRTRRRAGWVAEALRRQGIPTGLLHGDRSQLQRDKALADFAEGRAAVLVATDVAARGLHVPAVRTVVNYDIPLLPEEYVHRVGRAGHGGGFAESFTFLEPTSEERGRWRSVAELSGLRIEASPPPDFGSWLRPADRARLKRAAAREAQRKLESLDRARRTEVERRLEEARERAKRSLEARRRTTKRSGKQPNRFRGGIAKKRVDPKERPGRGVRRID